jgi:hypothetical protein
MSKIFLDAREMEHPEPLQISLAHLKSMVDSDYFYMLNFKNPTPLIEVAKEKGFFILEHEDSSDEWHIIITKNSELILEELVNV